MQLRCCAIVHPKYVQSGRVAGWNKHPCKFVITTIHNTLPMSVHLPPPDFQSQIDDSPILSLIHHYVDVLDDIYAKEPFACALLLRCLPRMAQGFVMRMMFIQGAIPFPELRTWHSSEQKHEANKSLWLLKQFSVLKGKGAQIWINAEFQGQIRSLLDPLKCIEYPWTKDFTKDADAWRMEADAHYEA